MESSDSESDVCQETDLTFDFADAEEIVIGKDGPVPAKPKRKRRKVMKRIPFPIESWEDLVRLATHVQTSRVRYYDCDILEDLAPAIETIDSLIGMKEIKSAIMDKILYHMQQPESQDMHHICIVGPSGCGKTTLANALANLYKCLGKLDRSDVIKGTRSNMIGMHVGHSAPKTKKLIDSAIGGTLLIDEAYQLGNGKDTDCFAKEVVDTLNQNLTERGHSFLCIVAGYADSMDRDFFGQNEGLKRRFPWRFEVEPYTSSELRRIFYKMVRDAGLTIDEDATGSEEWFKTRHANFVKSAGSIQNLVTKCHHAHFRRVFGTPDTDRLLVQEDLDAGYKLFLQFEDPEHQAKLEKRKRELIGIKQKEHDERKLSIEEKLEERKKQKALDERGPPVGLYS